MKLYGLLAILFTVSNVLAAHPCIYSKDNDKSQIQQKIEQNPWAKACFENIKSSVDKYVERYKTDPNWITSRLQMYWNSKYRDVYVNNSAFSHGDGNTPVPTPKFSGNRDWATSYEHPTIEDIKPYMDDPCGMWLQNKDKLGRPWEWVQLSQTGHIIETVNARIMMLAQNAAFIYWLTGDEDYAKFAADIFWTYTNGMYHRNNPQTYKNYGNKDLIGLATFEVIHETITISLAVCYDYLHDYLIKEGKDITIAEEVFRRWADRIIEGGEAKANWNIHQARFIVYMGLTLQDNIAYKDGKGKQYYLDSFLTVSRPNQRAIKDFVNDEYDIDQAIWPEAPGYAFDVTQIILEICNIIWNATGRDILLDYPVIEKAYLAYFQYLFPNGYCVGFGDTYHQRPESDALEILLTLYTRRSDEVSARNIAVALNKQIVDDYNRQNLNTIIALTSYVDKLPDTAGAKSSLSTPTYYSRPVNMFIQRNGYDEKTALSCTLTGTAGGHTHSNGMTMELYGLGMIIAPDSGVGTSYFQKEHVEYYVRFPAHNTVIVDGRSDYPEDKPGREAACRIIACEPLPGNVNRINPYNSFVDAVFIEPGATPAKQRRLLAIVRTSDEGGYYVDIFRSARLDKTDKFHDYILHGVGELAGINIELQRSSLLNSKNGILKGYDYFSDEKSAVYDGDLNVNITAPISDKETGVLKMWVAGNKDRTIFSVNAPKSRALLRGSAPKDLQGKPLLAILVRQNGQAWEKPFIVIYHPYLKEDGPDIESIEKVADEAGFIALKVKGKNGTQFILNSDCDYRRFKVDDIEFEGSYAVVSFQNDGKLDYIYLGRGRYIQAGGHTIDGRDNLISSGVNFRQKQDLP